MKIGLSQIGALERTFWKKLNGFAFSFIVFNGGENPNKTFFNCINASWKRVCGFRSQTLNVPSFIYHTAATPDFQTQMWERVLDFVLQSNYLCTMFSGNELLLQVQIQERGIPLILTSTCVHSNCKTEVGKKSVCDARTIVLEKFHL